MYAHAGEVAVEWLVVDQIDSCGSTLSSRSHIAELTSKDDSRAGKDVVIPDLAACRSENHNGPIGRIEDSLSSALLTEIPLLGPYVHYARQHYPHRLY
jgi:hypothetical protein